MGASAAVGIILVGVVRSRAHDHPTAEGLLAVADLPEPVVLIEFPFGEPAHDIVAMYYAGQHRRPLVNGYSGFFPERYHHRAGGLHQPLSDVERATRWLVDSGATHAVVHEAWFADGLGADVSAWLTSLGARLMLSDGSDSSR